MSYNKEDQSVNSDYLRRGRGNLKSNLRSILILKSKILNLPRFDSFPQMIKGSSDGKIVYIVEMFYFEKSRILLGMKM